MFAIMQRLCDARARHHFANQDYDSARQWVAYGDITTMDKVIGVGFAIGIIGVVFSVAFAIPAPMEPRFNLVQVTATGDAYIVDHGLTADDCDAAAVNGLRCEVESN